MSHVRASFRRGILEVAAVVLGHSLHARSEAQLPLRRKDRGMDTSGPVVSGIRARAAAAMERGPVLRSALQSRDPHVGADALAYAESMADASQSVRTGCRGVLGWWRRAQW